MAVSRYVQAGGNIKDLNVDVTEMAGTIYADASEVVEDFNEGDITKAEFEKIMSMMFPDAKYEFGE